MNTTPTLRDAAQALSKLRARYEGHTGHKHPGNDQWRLAFVEAYRDLDAALDALTQGAGEAVEPVAQPQIGWAILDRNERYMLFPMNCEAEACSYCEDGAQPVPVLADKAVLDQHEKDQGL